MFLCKLWERISETCVGEAMPDREMFVTILVMLYGKILEITKKILSGCCFMQ